LLCNQIGGNDSLIFDGASLVVDKKGRLLDRAKGFVEDDLFVDLSESHEPITFEDNPVESLESALVLGLSDYFRKQNFTKACLGLSGGIDSAVVACIAQKALGKDNVLALLMPSRYSSEGSIKDSLKLAENLGIEHREISIEQPFQSFLDVLKPHFKGMAPDSTEENLQARIRSMLLMAFSNKFGYIVLSTGNKSELAMGYSTLYGDMSGGLGVINDVTKRKVYALARHINKEKEVIPQEIIDKAPSAELRPNQKDSDALPPYDVIDNVLEAYVEEHKSPQEIIDRFGYDKSVVEEIVRAVHRNEYKRYQSPPGLRVSKKAFSVGRRFPIVQGWV
jgi:NAD+ synthase (glutamine-hydrolysing)